MIWWVVWFIHQVWLVLGGSFIFLLKLALLMSWALMTQYKLSLLATFATVMQIIIYWYTLCYSYSKMMMICLYILCPVIYVPHTLCKSNRSLCSVRLWASDRFLWNPNTLNTLKRHRSERHLLNRFLSRLPTRTPKNRQHQRQIVTRVEWQIVTLLESQIQTSLADAAENLRCRSH